MSQAYIVDAVRTPVGRKGGALSAEHPLDVAAHVLEALINRTGIDPSAVDDVVFGATDTVGPAAGDIARLAWLAAGLPESVPGVTLDRQCGSSQQAVHFAAQAVMSGTQDMVVAGGVQLMSVVPINHAWTAGKGLVHEDPFATSNRWQKRYGPAEVNQFLAAEMIADRWGLDRPTMEAFALRSHESALSAISSGYFASEIEPYGDFAVDECPRQTSLEKMAKLPTLSEGGQMTAALASQISDASAALLVCSEAALKEHGLTPRARIHTMTVAGDDPIMMLTAPIPATQKALRRAGLSLDDIDLIEINEAFASVVLAWQKELNVDPDRINVNGGAIALGHPIGASGARLMTSMLSELERRDARYGLQTMCEGGGQANVTIIERV